MRQRKSILKAVLILLCILLPSNLLLAAKEKPYNVVDEYGPKLDQVSFKERFLFNKTMNIDWYKSTLEQRKEFLEAYHEELVAAQLRKKELLDRDIAQQKEDKTTQKAEEKALLLKIRNEAMLERARLKSIENEKKRVKRVHEKLLKNLEQIRKREKNQKR